VKFPENRDFEGNMKSTPCEKGKPDLDQAFQKPPCYLFFLPKPKRYQRFPFIIKGKKLSLGDYSQIIPPVVGKGWLYYILFRYFIRMNLNIEVE